ncbi:hypothetical protein GCM10009609_00540 [Pseudonocardia aurantiaca]|uniref:UTRA domain-containing protein n=1 Tax=Pseudonocardia aurantiaca TaxID=75290 RepID=A0ABW4FCM5_9PSEU
MLETETVDRILRLDADGLPVLSLEHVAAGTPLREHVTAATLRFPLPPHPGE